MPVPDARGRALVPVPNARGRALVPVPDARKGLPSIATVGLCGIHSILQFSTACARITTHAGIAKW